MGLFVLPGARAKPTMLLSYDAVLAVQLGLAYLFDIR